MVVLSVERQKNNTQTWKLIKFSSQLYTAVIYVQWTKGNKKI